MIRTQQGAIGTQSRAPNPDCKGIQYEVTYQRRGLELNVEWQVGEEHLRQREPNVPSHVELSSSLH